MKPLLPTLKERQRYVVYEVITAQPAGHDISDTLLQSLASTLGVFGMAKAGVLSISYDVKTQTGILRCDHDHVLNVRAALLMATHLGRQQVLVRTLGVSGVLGKCKRFLPDPERKTDKSTTKGLRKRAVEDKLATRDTNSANDTRSKNHDNHNTHDNHTTNAQEGPRA
jgi:ribonuclease P/MRP protein subunit POP5